MSGEEPTDLPISRSKGNSAGHRGAGTRAERSGKSLRRYTQCQQQGNPDRSGYGKGSEGGQECDSQRSTELCTTSGRRKRKHLPARRRWLRGNVRHRYPRPSGTGAVGYRAIRSRFCTTAKSSRCTRSEAHARSRSAAKAGSRSAAQTNPCAEASPSTSTAICLEARTCACTAAKASPRTSTATRTPAAGR